MRYERPVATAFEMVTDRPKRWVLFGLPMLLNLAFAIGYTYWISARLLGHVGGPIPPEYWVRSLPYRLPVYIVSAFINYFLSAVATRAAQAQLAGEEPTWRSAFPMPRSVWVAIGCAVAFYAVDACFQAWFNAKVGSFNIWLTLWGLVTGTLLMLTMTIAATGDDDIVGALAGSLHYVGRRFFYCAWILLGLGLVSVGGVILVGIGLIWTLPVMPVGLLVLYRELEQGEGHDRLLQRRIGAPEEEV